MTAPRGTRPGGLATYEAAEYADDLLARYPSAGPRGPGGLSVN
jgi:hypothetical protein